MKQTLLLILAVFALLALFPTQSDAQVTIVVRPGYSNGYYYQGRPYYRHHYYHHYYRHHWQYND